MLIYSSIYCNSNFKNLLQHFEAINFCPGITEHFSISSDGTWCSNWTLFNNWGCAPRENKTRLFGLSLWVRWGCHVFNYIYILFVCFVFQGYWGCAIGKARQAAKTEIEKLQVWCNSVVLSQNIPSLSCYLLVPEMHQMQNWVKYFLVHLPVSQVSEWI